MNELNFNEIRKSLQGKYFVTENQKCALFIRKVHKTNGNYIFCTVDHVLFGILRQNVTYGFAAWELIGNNSLYKKANKSVYNMLRRECTDIHDFNMNSTCCII